MGSHRIGSLLAIGLVGSLLPNDALAAFPGRNGKIAFGTDRDPADQEIYVMNADGSGQSRLTNSGGNHSPAWSPDGTRIAFVSFRDDGGRGEIYVMNAGRRAPSGQYTLTVTLTLSDGSSVSDTVYYTVLANTEP